MNEGEREHRIRRGAPVQALTFGPGPALIGRWIGGIHEQKLERQIAPGRPREAVFQRPEIEVESNQH